MTWTTTLLDLAAVLAFVALQWGIVALSYRASLTIVDFIFEVFDETERRFNRKHPPIVIRTVDSIWAKKRIDYIDHALLFSSLSIADADRLELEKRKLERAS